MRARRSSYGINESVRIAPGLRTGLLQANSYNQILQANPTSNSTGPRAPRMQRPATVFFIVSIVVRIVFSLLPIVLLPASFLKLYQYLILQIDRISHCRFIVFFQTPGSGVSYRRSCPHIRGRRRGQKRSADRDIDHVWLRSARIRKRLHLVHY